MKNKVFDPYIFYIMLVIGFVFLRSGYGKLAGGKFVGGLEKTLGHFASENPYPPVQSFLNNFAIPNATLFGNLTMFGEIYVGISVFISVVYLLIKRTLTPVLFLVLVSGLLVAIMLNATFLLSAGWTSPSTESVNLVMLAVGVISLVYVIKTFVHVLKTR